MRHYGISTLTALAVFGMSALPLVSCGETGAVSSGEDTGKEIPTTSVDGTNELPFSLLDTGDSTGDSATPSDEGSAGDTPVLPGEFLSPCSKNEECFSGFCVEAPGGSVCTKQCETSCPVGWKCKGISAAGADQAFVCTPEHLTLCRPCHGPSDCKWTGFESAAICRSTGDTGSFCATPCDANSCPEGYTCEVGAGSGSFCVPTSGECACDPFARDQKLSTPCRVTNELGSCPGLRTCGADGLSGCDAPLPAEDICNGVDDNCDGVTDNGSALAGKTCEVVGQLGACAVGSPLCESGQEICIKVATPTPEVCNKQDDDCDGETDEPGANGCTTYYKDADKDGYGVESDSQCLCAPAAPYNATVFGDCNDDEPLAVPGAVEVCDGVDNDCNGTIDPVGSDGCKDWFFDEDGDTFGHPNKSRCQCKAEGAYSTQDHSDCNDKEKTIYPGAPETCDGIDQDCDGAVDEKVNQKPGCAANCKDDLVCAKECALSRPCTTNCGSGMEFCSGGAWKACSATPEVTCYDPTNGCEEFTTCSSCPGETTDSCDGVDTDCDGFTDEDFASETTACGIGACMAEGVSSCPGGTLQDDCTPNLAMAAPEICNGVDDDCDGKADGADPDLVLPACALQQGVCNGATMMPNLCGAEGWPAECPESRYKAHNANYQAGNETSCDGLDNDCDGETDEDFSIISTDGSSELAIGADCGTGACAGGTVLCAASKTSAVCSTADESAAETCNGVDDNCDGTTDGVTRPCDLGCGGGTETCLAGEWETCVAPVPTECTDYATCTPKTICVTTCPGPPAETCNGADDNCDGSTDEGVMTTFYVDVDKDGVGSSAGTQLACTAPDGYVAIDGDCDDTTDAVKPGLAETCDGLDNDCNSQTDESLGDSTCGTGVCEHTAPNCVGGVSQICDPLLGADDETCDGFDNDCDGQTDEDQGDITCGKGACQQVLPACVGGVVQVCDPLSGQAPEICNGIDDNCDGQTDEGLAPLSCGQGACEKTVASCVAGTPQTCDPMAGQTPESCDGVDNDCDGQTDEQLGDLTCGKGVCLHTIAKCMGGTTQICDPLEGAGVELCNGKDDDCDGQTDESDPQTGSSCPVPGKSGLCAQGVYQCQGGSLQCSQTTFPTSETCDGKDNDCDGPADEDLGTETCGNGVCFHTIQKCQGGVTQTCNPFEGASSESCDNKDNDCDGTTDSFTENCQVCGTGSRTCNFGQWGQCNAPGPICQANTYTCSGGNRMRCSSDGCRWDLVEQCSCGCSGTTCTVGECSPGSSETQGCGTKCGTHKRTCNSACQWNSWGSCGGEGTCSAGASEQCDACGWRSCNTSCNWGSCVDSSTYKVTPTCSSTTTSASYTCPGGVVLSICGTVSSSGKLTVTVSKSDGSSLGAGKYRVLTFDSSTSTSQKCSDINVVKSTKTTSSSTTSITFSSFDSLAPCGTKKNYCVVKEDGGNIAHFCSGELKLNY